MVRGRRINPIAVELEENELLGNILMWMMFQNNSPLLFTYEAEGADGILQPGESKELVNKSEVGKLDAVQLVTTSSKLRIVLEVDGHKIQGTAEELYQYGLLGYNPATFYLTVYDDLSTPNQFVMWMTPEPKREYFGHFKITLKNEDSVPASYAASLFRYMLKPEFMEFFRRV